MIDLPRSVSSLPSHSSSASKSSARRPAGKLKPWHWTSIATAILLLLPIVWFILAYGSLPRIWSRHEHKKIASREQIQTYTAQDIPGDPINLRIFGSQQAITCAFKHAGWSVADAVSLRSGLGIGASVILQKPYPQAPVSPLYFQDQKQTTAFEKDEGKSADKRHHVRIWQVGRNQWFGAATFDRGVGIGLFTLQVTHHIGPNVDADRNAAGDVLLKSGARLNGAEPNRLTPGQWHRNGGGDKYRTDGLIRNYVLTGNGSC